MADKTDDEIISVQIANQFINVANARMHDGIAADDIALGLRHAAANFSAYAFASHPNAGDPNVLVEAFVAARIALRLWLLASQLELQRALAPRP